MSPVAVSCGETYTLEQTMIKHAIALAAAALLSGCAVYTPRDLSAMSSADICYIEYIQGRNLSAEGRQAIQSEMQRRKDNCGNHSANVKQLFADFMHYETYGKQHP